MTKVSVPGWTPPRWMNVSMKAMLRIPGLAQILGRSLALITVTGHRTGRRYTTPVTYHREGNSVIVLTKTYRKWWRNLRDEAEVELLLRGRLFRGRGRASVGEEESLPGLAAFLENHCVDARAYGVRCDDDGRADPESLRALLSQIVVIRISLSGEERGGGG